MLKARLDNDNLYNNILNHNERNQLDRAIIKLITLRTIEDRTQTQIIDHDSIARNNNAHIAPLNPFNNRSAGGKILTMNNGAIPTQTLLEYLADQIKASSFAYNNINVVGTLNQAAGALAFPPVDWAFLKLAAIGANNVNA